MTHHPRALYILALVQLWERFACFATLPLLILYVEQHHGLSPDGAVLLFGLLQALSYLGGLPGGYVADRWLGHRLATFLGTLLLTLGYGALTIERSAMLWLALVLLVLGHGLFKPGLNALVGGLYAERDPRRDSGFMLLHVIFNAGATVAPIVAEWARARWGWVAIFQVGTVGMLASMASFALGSIMFPRPPKGTVSASLTLSAASRRERTRACWLVCGLGVVFWLAATQANTSLTLFAAHNTDLRLVAFGHVFTVAPGHFMALHSLLVLVLMPPLGWVLALLRRRGTEVSTPGKMTWGFAATSAAFAVMGMAGLRGVGGSQVGMSWLCCCYVLLTLGELLLAPMGLALVTRLAPPERKSRLVALWFAAIAAGNGLAGASGALWTRWPQHRYFALLALLPLGASMVLLVRTNWLERLIASTSGATVQLPALVAGAEPSPNSPVPIATASKHSRKRLLLVCLIIIAPITPLVSDRVPASVSAVGAILCGLAVLLGGSYLVGQVIDRLSLAREAF